MLLIRAGYEPTRTIVLRPNEFSQPDFSMAVTPAGGAAGIDAQGRLEALMGSDGMADQW